MAFEHRDITPEKRPEHTSSLTHERARAEFFAVLMRETVREYKDARRREKPGKAETALNSIEFFFKKSWDRFAEPVLEYEDLLAGIMVKKWESNGAKSRALSELNERRAKSVEGIEVLVPDFDGFDQEKKVKTLARMYEGYAGFIHENEGKLGKLAEEVDTGFGYLVNYFLHTRDNRYMRELTERRIAKEQRRKEKRKTREEPTEAGP